jgi:hypothetical protein
MLRDRRVLMEQEMVKQKQACGSLYLKIATGEAGPIEHKMYDSMKLKLADMMSELAIVDQMIVDGHQ